MVLLGLPVSMKRQMEVSWASRGFRGVAIRVLGVRSLGARSLRKC
jgi:hypothetical protein